MSIVDDQVQRLDTALDRIQLSTAERQDFGYEDAQGEINEIVPQSTDSAQAVKLKALVRSLSTTSGSKPLLTRRRLRDALSQLYAHGNDQSWTLSITDEEMYWLAVAKATVQVYGLVLNALLDQTIPLSESIWYWDDVLGSYVYTGLYTLQTSPVRFWDASKEVYQDAIAQWRSNRSVSAAAQQGTESLAAGWKEFYGLVTKSIEARSLAVARSRILSPFALCRTEARRKQENVKKIREQSAAAIGLLVEEGLNLQEEDWKETVVKGVRLLEGITTHTQTVKAKWTELEEQIAGVLMQPVDEPSPTETVESLLRILDEQIPKQEKESQLMVQQYGKPPRLIRYWIPGLVLFFSGSTLLRIALKRRQEIITWIEELGSTTIDFWYNWVVEPVKRLIGTIRHDENSELAIMSKDSLLSDRESLERMVVDFTKKNPPSGSTLTEAQVAEIKQQVRRGDLSMVLKAYEQEIQSPAKNAIFGNLVQGLLIQVQKTKVDVEVAMNGIDEILKSQELLFGFVGLAPGIVVTWLTVRWLSSSLGGRKGLRTAQEQGDTVRLLRNIDRTLNNAIPTEEGMLSYKDNGLLLCEIHVLRQTAAKVIPSTIFNRDFIEDIKDLMNINQGIEKQLRVLARIERAYSKWLR